MKTIYSFLLLLSMILLSCDSPRKFLEETSTGILKPYLYNCTYAIPTYELEGEVAIAFHPDTHKRLQEEIENAFAEHEAIQLTYIQHDLEVCELEVVALCQVINYLPIVSCIEALAWEPIE